VQLTQPEACLFLRLVSWRYQKSSTIITTNKAVKDWPEVFAGDDVMVTALLDRSPCGRLGRSMHRDERERSAFRWRRT